METATATSQLEEIGATAGLVWNYLRENEAVTMTKLGKEVDAPRDLVMQAVGWLAREGKLQFQENKRTKLISLTE